MTYPIANYIYGWSMPEDFQEELRTCRKSYQDHFLMKFYVPKEDDPNFRLLSLGYEKVTVDGSFFNEDGFNEDYVCSEYTAGGDYDAAYLGYHCYSCAYWELKENEPPEVTPEILEEFEKVLAEVPPEYVAYLRDRFGEPRVEIVWGAS